MRHIQKFIRKNEKIFFSVSLAGHKRDTNTLKSLCVETKTHEIAISTRSFWKIIQSRVLRLQSRVFWCSTHSVFLKQSPSISSREMIHTFSSGRVVYSNSKFENLRPIILSNICESLLHPISTVHESHGFLVPSPPQSCCFWFSPAILPSLSHDFNKC